ncbi:50S ribosomal protein L21 [Candidatus Shapirobacteria bacterium CG09_land_8_20_14_0_10_49_15]|uniref:Large ribosomal subunit protein bL21 n=2 Tax=Candidatus Shapironibacteriota TaxID=1752721 RepID=A0A2M8L6H5_9BACT|nr:MAG: 50S ribosomal protein L21 [Candidatus Shapirobacteria bacterium CG09_land_8_20_14_0_10_49_15]PJE69807.1 MAG: 50S ribosomal protein L21 [Candidatus Shapirobacteria bacterium CG10_big_fil_rev_8_21_14_0_10_48_15]
MLGMDNFVIVKINGSQQKVSEGDEVVVDKVDGQEGAALKLAEVLLVADKNKTQVGQPLVKDASVQAKILKQFQGKKIRVATYKAKSRYRRVLGFRSQLTRLKIEKITTV